MAFTSWASRGWGGVVQRCSCGWVGLAQDAGMGPAEEGLQLGAGAWRGGAWSLSERRGNTPARPMDRAWTLSPPNIYLTRFSSSGRPWSHGLSAQRGQEQQWYIEWQEATIIIC
jgi:hypothetical protein